MTWGQFAAADPRRRALADRARARARRSRRDLRAELGRVGERGARRSQTAGAVFVPIYPASTRRAGRVHPRARRREVRVRRRHRATRAHGACTEPARACGRGGRRSTAPRGPRMRPRRPPTTGRSGAAAARDAAAPTLVDARLGALELDAPGADALHERHLGQPEGRAAHASQRRRQRRATGCVCNAPLLAEGDRDLLWLPMSHIFGFGELCVGNLLGWETYLASPADVLDCSPRSRRRCSVSVPAYWEKIARAMQAGPHSDDARQEALRRVTGGRLRFCLSGGAGPQGRDQAAAPPRRPARHRGLRPDRDLADVDAQPPRRLPVRHRRQAAARRSSSSSTTTARSSRAARTCSPATSRIRPRPRPRSPTTAGSAPATSAGGPTTASCRSSIARRTSSSPPAARTSRRRTSRRGSSTIR